MALLLRRLFKPRISVQILFFFLTITLIIFSSLLTILNFVQCSPTAGFWDPSVHAECWDYKHFEGIAIFTGAYSAFIDFTFAIYPTPILWGLQLSRKRKIGLSMLVSSTSFVPERNLPWSRWESVLSQVRQHLSNVSS